MLLIGALTVAESSRGPRAVGAECVQTVPWVLDEQPVAAARDRSSQEATLALDVATYNLHSGLGLTHAFFRRRAAVEANLRAIAASIAAASGAGGPHVVALNEVDFGSRRSAWIDQARFMGDELETLTGSVYRIFRGETWRRDLPGFEASFGNAALVRLPVQSAHACRFDDLGACGVDTAKIDSVAREPGSWFRRALSEPRGVIRLSVELDGRAIDVLVTHLDAFDMRAREHQAALLLNHLLRPDRTTVLLGDMNAVPLVLTRERRMFSGDRTHAILATGSLADASVTFASHRGERSLAAWATYPADAPVWGLDWVLGSLDLSPQSVAAIGEAASDHRGLFVRYRCLRDAAEIEAARLRHGRLCERLRSHDPQCAAGG
jgi:endonuclease/exonuclease/phosphatase family metal-dependent hydrolase